MPPKPLGERALTNAERQARHQERKAQQAGTLRFALQRIQHAKSVREARQIAADALA